jgi:3-methyladenine DNA glycosylase/8-oxoguanine DNA glycosylase
LSCEQPFDVALTFGPLSHGPASRVTKNDWWHAMNTPEGDVTVHVHVDRTRGAVEVEAWGDAREWIIERARDLLGFDGDASRFVPTNPTIASLRRDLSGMRLARLGCSLDVAAATVIEQRVTTVEARRSWRMLVFRYGKPAPARPDLRLPPAADVLRALPDWEWKRMGVEWRRSQTVRTVAAESGRIDRTVERGSAALDRRLRTLRGVGAWTAATVVHYVAGDPDAVPVGDWHLPGHVGYALAGDPRADDARMLELLEPFRPHRAWVWRMIVAGTPAPPRRAPRTRIIGLLQAEASRPRGTTRSARR